MASVRDLICTELGFSRAWLDAAIDRAPSDYRKLVIKKKTGGVRTLLQPSVEAKMIQYWLLARIFDTLPVSKISTAFESGASILLNAQSHAASLYSVRVDIQDFFPSITANDLIAAIKHRGGEAPGWATSDEVGTVIKRTCFDRNGRLPIGYPSSPKIANVVMFNLDERLLAKIRSEPEIYGSTATLTRYADDFVFSTDRTGACNAFVTTIRDVLRRTTSPNLRINEKKTRLMSRRGGSTLITGLRVKQDGDIGIHAHQRSHIRLLLKLFAAGRLAPERYEHLRGHLAYIQHVDPALFTSLSFRYSGEIAKLRACVTEASIVVTAPPVPKAA